MFIQNETLHEHFKVNSKSVGRGRLLKKSKMIITKKHGRVIFVICQFVFLIGF